MKSCEWPGCLRPEDHASLHIGAGGKRFSDEDALEAAATRWDEFDTKPHATLPIRTAVVNSRTYIQVTCIDCGDAVEVNFPDTVDGLREAHFLAREHNALHHVAEFHG